LRFAAEKAALALSYCNLFKFWRDCHDKRSRRHRRCCGNADECLKRRADEIPRQQQFGARQAVMTATPKNAGPAERPRGRFWRGRCALPAPRQRGRGTVRSMVEGA
jgi:hypothetical protein